jgi:hypothetical protein
VRATLYGIFVINVVFSYFEDFVVVAISFLVGVPLLITVFKIGHNNHNTPPRVWWEQFRNIKEYVLYVLVYANYFCGI